MSKRMTDERLAEIEERNNRYSPSILTNTIRETIRELLQALKAERERIEVLDEQLDAATKYIAELKARWNDILAVHERFGELSRSAWCKEKPE